MPRTPDLNRDGGSGHGAGEEALVGLPVARHRHRPLAIDDDDSVRAFVDSHLVPAGAEIDYPLACVPHGRHALDLARDAPRTGREPRVHHRRDRDEHGACLVRERRGVEAPAELLLDEGGGEPPLGETRAAEHRIEEARVVGDARELVAV